MVRTDDAILVAGPVGEWLVSQEALDGKEEAALLAISPKDGSVLAEMSLPAAPVWDGMAAARGNLYISLANGQTICLWSVDSGRPGKPLSVAAWRAVLPQVEIDTEPGLVGRWPMNEGRGMLAQDCSDRGHDARVKGRWAKEDGRPCIATEGMTGAVVIPDSEHLQFGNDDFTMSMWIKIDRYDARILGKERFPANWWVINLLETGVAELVLGEGTGKEKSVRLSTTTPLAKDRWTHLAVVADRQAGTLRWYIDGKEDTRAPIPKTMTEGIHGAGRVISIPSSYKPLDGFISDFRIYRKALDASRVSELSKE